MANETIPMKELIVTGLAQYRTNANIIEEDNFINDVFDSFTKSHTQKHYIIIIDVSIDDYFDTETIESFNKNGYFRWNVESRYDNQFLVPRTTKSDIKKLLEYEGLVCEYVEDEKRDEKVLVVTLNGYENSHFVTDFQKK